MHIINGDLVRRALDHKGESVKFILGDRAVVFFPATQQHREIKTQGLSYEDDYQGNAVAGLLTSGRVEIRFHARYSEGRIRAIWSRLRARPEFAGIEPGKVYYQGREIIGALHGRGVGAGTPGSAAAGTVTSVPGIKGNKNLTPPEL